MIQLPISFEALATVRAGLKSPWQILSNQTLATVSVPAEFGGPGGGFSPEDLFAQALANCFVGTFKVLAENSNLTFEQLKTIGQLIVDKDDSGQTVMKEFHLQVMLTKPSNLNRATLLVKKAMSSGFILNSVKTKINYDLVID